MRFEKSYDVLVAGAGVAGVAASVAAARAGARTALVEKTVLVGGLATAGLIAYYTPLCDGRGRQVTFGLAEEMLRLSIRYGPGEVPPCWDEETRPEAVPRYAVRFSPASFTLALDELLAQAGVDVWLDTLACLPVMDGARLAGVEVENKSGRGLLRAGCVVDATGDADLAYRAGAPCEEARNWLSLWAIETSMKIAKDAASADSGEALLDVAMVGADNRGHGHPDGVPTFRGTDGREVTEFVLRGRAMLRERYEARQAALGAHGRADLFPVALPAMAQFRTTRRILGRTNLEDGMAGQHFDEAVGLVAHWAVPGEVWEVPYGALVPREVTGLLTAGRCIGAGGRAWEVMRVVHAAAHTGEIAGTAAALAIERHAMPHELDVAELRRALEARGIRHDAPGPDEASMGGQRGLPAL